MEMGKTHRQRLGYQCGGRNRIPIWGLLQGNHSSVRFNIIPRLKLITHHYSPRVVQPPPDQQSYTRLGLFYFAMANDDIKLAPLMQSPVLQRVGVTRLAADEGQKINAPTMQAWRIGRTAAYGVTELKMADKEKGIEEEIINDIVVRHYN